jgi:hypothetical protein
VKKTPFSSAFLIAIIIGGLILVSTLHFGIVHASTNVSGIITSDTTWMPSGSPYVLTGNTLVYDGVTLTIQAGVTVNLDSYYIMVNGTLQAIGNSSNPITFNGGQITFTQYSASWDEQTGSGCLIENAILTSTVLSSNNAVKINRNTIGIGFTVASSTIISNNTIKGNVNGGIVSDNTITGDVNSPTILNNTITGNVGSASVASNNMIKGGITAMGNCTISNNTILDGLTSSGDAVYVPSFFFQAGGYPIIENNLITNSTVGIDVSVYVRMWVGTNIPLIQNNLISKNDIGIRFGMGYQDSYGNLPPTIIQNNTMTQNDIGIQLIGSAEEYEIINNNIQDNINYSLYLQGTTNNVNATYNWWGTTDTQAINQTIYDFKNDFTLGKVDFVPFLTEPNPAAPAVPPAIPEFPSWTILPLLTIVMIGTTLLIYFKKRVRWSGVKLCVAVNAYEFLR